MKSTDLRPGMAIIFDGKLYVCTQFQHVTPGNLRAFVQAKLKCLADGIIIEKRLRSGEELERAYLDRREMEFLYSDSSGYIFMDNQSYDQYTLPTDQLGDRVRYLKPNTPVICLFTEGNIVAIELPKSVTLEIKETAPVPKGATVTNQMKDAVLETGLKTRVPPFIVTGELVRINTEDGSYLSRA